MLRRLAARATHRRSGDDRGLDSHTCSPWLERTHPDPQGEQLRKIAFVLRAFATHAQAEYGEGCRVGVFWDYISLPQPRRDGIDDRSVALKARFKAALRGINTWFVPHAPDHVPPYSAVIQGKVAHLRGRYGHPKTHVLLVSTPLPTGASYYNLQPYEGRGW